MRTYRIFIILFAGIILSCTNKQNNISHVEHGQFVRGSEVDYYIGTNFWYGPILASEGKGGDRVRLQKELDTLKSLGITNLRVLVGADGPDGVATRIDPTLQKESLVYNDTLLQGLDYFMAELGKRDMQAVLFLNNAWEWSGGYGMYLEWASEGKAAIPAEIGYPAYMDSMARFPIHEKAKSLFAEHVKFIVSRTNSVTGLPYSEDPAIFSWQICNEPRCFSSDPKVQEAFTAWLWDVASLIKSIDGNHMVSTGNEGAMGCEESIELYERIHSCPDIDYMTIHIWPYNWSWAREGSLSEDLTGAIARTDEYISSHIALAQKYGKPVVIEEFGFPRDGLAFSKGSDTKSRDIYYKHLFNKVEMSAAESGLLAGVNFWAWGGLAAQAEGHSNWVSGDDYCGDPAQEPQGLNSVYCGDSTVEIIKESIQAIEAAGPNAWIEVEQTCGIYPTEGEHELKAGVNCSPMMQTLINEGVLSFRLDLETDFGEVEESYKPEIKIDNGVAKLSFNIKLTTGFHKARLMMLNRGVARQITASNLGCNPEAIVSPTSKEADFDAFWDETLKELAAVEPEYKFTLLKEYSDEVRNTYRVDMKSLGGESICAILIEPKADGKYPAFITYLGYGSKVWYPGKGGTQDRVELRLCIRNQSLNRKDGEKDDWCVRGLADKYTYYYRGAFSDAVRGVDCILSREKVDSARFYAHGESQGGALTLVAASLDHRIKGIVPSAPFLSDYPDYFKLADWPGSPIVKEAERLGMSEEEMHKVLSYFDVKNFTDRISCPVLMGIGLQDPVCPPHTNFAGYNNIRSEKRWICYPFSGHNVWEQKGWPEAKEEFFRNLYQNFIN